MIERGPCLCCQFSKVSTPVLQKVVRRARRPEGEKGLAKAVNVEEQNLEQTWRCVGTSPPGLLPLASCLLPLASLPLVSCLLRAVPLRLHQP